MLYKSTRNSRRIAILSGFVAVLVFVAVAPRGEDDSSILEYYWDQASRKYPDLDPLASGLSFSLTAKSYRHSVGDEGRITRSDSALQTFFYSRGSLDSITTERGRADNFKEIDLVPPTVFSMPYHRSLFPNDTGGTYLPIELISDSLNPDQPDGLVVIGRYDYFPRSLYMYYPNWSGFRRYTRSFRFQMVDGYLFPDSVWTVAVQLGVFFADSFRLESQITDISIFDDPITADSLSE